MVMVNEKNYLGEKQKQKNLLHFLWILFDLVSELKHVTRKFICMTWAV